MLRAFALRGFPIVASLAVAAFVPSAPVSAAEVSEARTESVISWTPDFEYATAVVAISGPGGVTSWPVAEAGPLAIDMKALEKWAGSGSQSVDGAYNYELRFLPRVDEKTRTVLTVLRAEADGAAVAGAGVPELPVVSGNFVVSDGAIVVADMTEENATKDIVHNDDVIATSSLCVGFDCVNGENFGFDTMRLKENNLRINFADTSNSAAFPTNDWRIVANDTSNGGASYLGIEDSDAGRMPFRVEAGARSNALYVKSNGRIGIGTSVPAVLFHMAYGDTPTVRLDQDGSWGWPRQVWDVAGNEANFFIRDATNGSKLSFRIEPNTPDSTLTLKASGNVGVGTWSPTAPLEVQTTSEDATLLLDRTDGGQWYLTATADGTFTIGTAAGAGGELLILDSLGNLTTSGTVNGISDRDAKTGFEAVDTARVLTAVSALPITSWSLIGDRPGVRHIGPTAQDFYTAFGIGADERHITVTDVGGVALAAIQALTAELDARDRQIDDLTRRLEALEAQLGR